MRDAATIPKKSASTKYASSRLKAGSQPHGARPSLRTTMRRSCLPNVLPWPASQMTWYAEAPSVPRRKGLNRSRRDRDDGVLDVDAESRGVESDGNPDDHAPHCGREKVGQRIDDPRSGPRPERYELDDGECLGGRSFGRQHECRLGWRVGIPGFT